MSGPSEGARARVVFNDVGWAEDVASATESGRTAARSWRARVERDGLAVAELRACQAEGPEGTQLAGCAKVYVPAPAGPYGAVLRLALDLERRPVLALVAFGLRHPPPGLRQSVYQVAHRRLHAT